MIQSLLVSSDKGTKRLDVSFDSTIPRSLIKKDAAMELSTLKRLLIPKQFVTADGKKIVCDKVCDLIVEIEGKKIDIEGFIVDELPTPLVLGALDTVRLLSSLTKSPRMPL